jgi:aflatoxin B1 aldehyde reductase
VSNTPPAVLEKILQLCEQNDWPKPTYYQGTYNVISRGMETKLWPILRAHGIHFVAFWSVHLFPFITPLFLSPTHHHVIQINRAIASGFLTGNLVNGNQAGTRLADDNPLGKTFQRMYGAEEVMQAVRTFDKDTRALGLTPLEVSVRWIFHHSKLTDDDCVLLGASRAAQIIENVAFVRKGPLPENVLLLVDELWESVKATRGEII